MKKPMKYLALAAAFSLSGGLVAAPASAQLRLGVGVPDVDVNVGARVETRTTGPYVYQGYESGYWHPRGDVYRRYYWDARYDGYDCYEAFQYTYERGHRVRYESTFCYDRYDRPYEVRQTRIVAKVR